MRLFNDSTTSTGTRIVMVVIGRSLVKRVFKRLDSISCSSEEIQCGGEV